MVSATKWQGGSAAPTEVFVVTGRTGRRTHSVCGILPIGCQAVKWPDLGFSSYHDGGRRDESAPDVRMTHFIILGGDLRVGESF